jgi:hypothetical protein
MRHFAYVLRKNTSVTYDAEPGVGHFRAFLKFPILLRRWFENYEAHYPFEDPNLDDYQKNERWLQVFDDTMPRMSREEISSSVT